MQPDFFKQIKINLTRNALTHALPQIKIKPIFTLELKPIQLFLVRYAFSSTDLQNHLFRLKTSTEFDLFVVSPIV